MAAKKSKKQKSVATRVKKAGSITKRAVKKVSKVASNPRRTVRKAADDVHQRAKRARGMGESVATAGELIIETADFVDSVAQRVKARTPARRRRRR